MINDLISRAKIKLDTKFLEVLNKTSRTYVRYEWGMARNIKQDTYLCRYRGQNIEIAQKYYL